MRRATGRRKITRTADFDPKTNVWTVRVNDYAAGEVAQVTIDDASGRVTEALAGPQVAWQIARGAKDACDFIRNFNCEIHVACLQINAATGWV